MRSRGTACGTLKLSRGDPLDCSRPSAFASISAEMSTPYLFDLKLYEQIRATWERDQRHPHRGRAPSPVPGLDAIAAVADTAFRASIEREEGQTLRFSLLHLPRDAPAAAPCFAFPQPLEFSERTLRKLAGAFAPSASALLVASSNGEWFVWGFGYFGSAIYRIQQLPVSTGYEVMWPDVLRIRVEAPGRLTVARGDSCIGYLETGRWLPAIPTPLTSRAMGDRLIAAIREDAGYVAHQVHYWHYYSEALEYLLQRLGQAGHGATLILVPRAHRSDVAGKFHDGYAPVGSFQLAELVGKRISLQGHDSVILAAGLDARIFERLDALADLARIDGALVIDTEFEVIAFGAKLKSSPWNGAVDIGPDGFNANGQPFDLSRHGTRHNSAASFVGSCPWALAFVVSSDGPIRGFAYDNGGKRLLCWPDFRASMRLSTV